MSDSEHREFIREIRDAIHEIRTDVAKIKADMEAQQTVTKSKWWNIF
jgi:hypothetical protein